MRPLARRVGRRLGADLHQLPVVGRRRPRGGPAGPGTPRARRGARRGPRGGPPRRSVVGSGGLHGPPGQLVAEGETRRVRPSRTPDASASTSVSLPVARASASHRSARPGTTLSVRSSSRTSGASPAILPRTASRTVVGTASTPAAMTSVTKNGFPPVIRCTSAASSSPKPPRSRTAATESGSSGSRTTWSPSRVPSSRVSGWSPARPLLRKVATRTTGMCRDPAGEVPHGVERRVVRPVQVLDHRDGRPAPEERQESGQHLGHRPGLERRRGGPSRARPVRRPCPGRARGCGAPPGRRSRRRARVTSPARPSMKARTSADLPTPASPETSTRLPRPVSAAADTQARERRRARGRARTARPLPGAGRPWPPGPVPRRPAPPGHRAGRRALRTGRDLQLLREHPLHGGEGAQPGGAVATAQGGPQQPQVRGLVHGVEPAAAPPTARPRPAARPPAPGGVSRCSSTQSSNASGRRTGGRSPTSRAQARASGGRWSRARRAAASNSTASTRSGVPAARVTTSWRSSRIPGAGLSALRAKWAALCSRGNACSSGRSGHSASTTRSRCSRAPGVSARSCDELGGLAPVPGRSVDGHAVQRTENPSRSRTSTSTGPC